MLIEYLAHASFLLRSARGASAVIDPYDPEIGYGAVNRSCDILVISHEHRDHNHTAAVHGRAVVVRSASGERTVAGIPIKSILACHDDCGGERLGYSTITVVEMDGMKCCHLGDLGHLLAPAHLSEIGEVDVLFVPVGGGGYTIGPDEAHKVGAQLKARMIIPMHYGTGQLKGDEFPLQRLDAFLEGDTPVRRIRQSLMELTVHDLPSSPEIVAMNYTF